MIFDVVAANLVFTSSPETPQTDAEASAEKRVTDYLLARRDGRHDNAQNILRALGSSGILVETVPGGVKWRLGSVVADERAPQ